MYNYSIFRDHSEKGVHTTRTEYKRTRQNSNNPCLHVGKKIGFPLWNGCIPQTTSLIQHHHDYYNHDNPLLPLSLPRRPLLSLLLPLPMRLPCGLASSNLCSNFYVSISEARQFVKAHDSMIASTAHDHIIIDIWQNDWTVFVFSQYFFQARQIRLRVLEVLDAHGASLNQCVALFSGSKVV